MPAADLIRQVESLSAPYGLERSVKITRGALADDRCLISVDRAALGPAPAERLLAIAHALHIPPDFADALPASLDGAEIVHFGYEAAAGRDVYKIYCEYASAARAAMAAKSAAATLVHLAYKWMPARAESRAVTRYTWVPCRSRIELDERLEHLVPFREAANARRCVATLLSRIPAYANSGRLLLMEVEERGNPRRSCDLNVYDAGLRMRDIADLVDAAVADFAVPEARARSVFGAAAGRALGHLSAGLGRDEQEFVTFYFGVEAH